MNLLSESQMKLLQDFKERVKRTESNYQNDSLENEKSLCIIRENESTLSYSTDERGAHHLGSKELPESKLQRGGLPKLRFKLKIDQGIFFWLTVSYLKNESKDEKENLRGDTEDQHSTASIETVRERSETQINRSLEGLHDSSGHIAGDLLEQLSGQQKLGIRFQDAQNSLLSSSNQIAADSCFGTANGRDSFSFAKRLTINKISKVEEDVAEEAIYRSKFYSQTDRLEDDYSSEDLRIKGDIRAITEESPLRFRLRTHESMSSNQDSSKPGIQNSGILESDATLRRSESGKNIGLALCKIRESKSNPKGKSSLYESERYRQLMKIYEQRKTERVFHDDALLSKKQQPSKTLNKEYTQSDLKPLGELNCEPPLLSRFSVLNSESHTETVPLDKGKKSIKTKIGKENCQDANSR